MTDQVTQANLPPAEQEVHSLPTGKSHISFSEIKCWSECAFRHKLLYIDGLSEDVPTIFSDFGTVCHSGCEQYLKTRVMDKAAAVAEITKLWEERGYPNIPNWSRYASSKLEDWISYLDFLDDVPGFLDQNFPGWELVSAEDELFTPLYEGSDVSFKGFIDCVIRVPSGKGKFIYWILDWKTAGTSGWHRDKKRSPIVQMQLRYYKHFWSQKTATPFNSIRCGFVLLKRGAKKKKKCDLVTVSVGEKTAERELHRAKSMVSAIRIGRFPKNRYSCTFCEFANTPHCKRNL